MEHGKRLPVNVYVVAGITRNRNKTTRYHRMIFDGFEEAFRHWKSILGTHRAALFYWDSDGNCAKLYETHDYNLSRDFP